MLTRLSVLPIQLIFNMLIALIGFNLWYVIRFNMRENSTAFDMVINHLIIAVVIISIWVSASYFILVALFKENTNYVQFLNESLPWRAVLGVFFYLIFIQFYYVILYYEDLQEKLTN